MKKVVSIQNFWPVSRKEGWDILGSIRHTYGECSSICDLADNDSRSSKPGEIGIIDLYDLGLIEGTVTFQDVIDTSLKQDYSKITFSEIMNYIKALKSQSGGFDFGSRTAVVVLMDQVVDGDGISGVVYLQPDDQGILYRLGFLDQPDYSKPLARVAKFLVKKLIE